MGDLKPCPFCGAKAVICRLNDGKGLYGYAIGCERTTINCPGAMPMTKYFHTYDLAVEEWNRRVTERTCRFNVVIDQDPTLLRRGNICECDACGYRCAYGFIVDERFKFCPNCGARIEVGA